MAAMRQVVVGSAAIRSPLNVAIPHRRGTAEETNAMRIFSTYPVRRLVRQSDGNALFAPKRQPIRAQRPTIVTLGAPDKGSPATTKCSPRDLGLTGQANEFVPRAKEAVNEDRQVTF
jgi:hypothetical protein